MKASLENRRGLHAFRIATGVFVIVLVVIATMFVRLAARLRRGGTVIEHAVGMLILELAQVSAEQAPNAPWVARRFARVDRERAMGRMQAGERLAECALAGDDGSAFVECWRRAVERDDVPSVMSRVVAVNPPSIDETLALQRDVLSR